jgi:acetyltransferase-like isoleucine patch superfamily enzyme
MKNFFKVVIKKLILFFPLIKKIIETSGTSAPITFRTYFFQKIIGFNRKAYWPMHHSSIVTHPQNILLGKACAPGISSGCYIQGNGGIIIGDYTIVAPNVGIISGNHNKYDYRQHVNKKVEIGKYCWIGMGVTVLPGVVIGDHTIVAAGSIVTKSFSEGYCVLAGNPAKMIDEIQKDKCVEYNYKYDYIGYKSAKRFYKYKSKFINSI